MVYKLLFLLKVNVYNENFTVKFEFNFDFDFDLNYNCVINYMEFEQWLNLKIRHDGYLFSFQPI